MTETVIKAVVSVLVTTMFGLIIAKIKGIAQKQKTAEQRQKALESGLQSLLRAEIIRTYEKSIDRGYCPIYSKEALEICYTAYHDGLKGNGAMKDIYEKTMKLPTQKR